MAPHRCACALRALRGASAAHLEPAGVQRHAHHQGEIINPEIDVLDLKL